jgi:hypothetical protein
MFTLRPQPPLPPTSSQPTIAALECHHVRRRTIEVPRASHRTSSLPSWSWSSSSLLGVVVASSPRTPPPSLHLPIISPRQHIAQDDAVLSSPLHAASSVIYLYGKRGSGKGEWTSLFVTILFCCASDASCDVGTSSPN